MNMIRSDISYCIYNSLDVLYRSMLKNIIYCLRQKTSAQRSRKFYHRKCLGTVFLSCHLLLPSLVSLHCYSLVIVWNWFLLAHHLYCLENHRLVAGVLLHLVLLNVDWFLFIDQCTYYLPGRYCRSVSVKVKMGRINSPKTDKYCQLEALVVSLELKQAFLEYSWKEQWNCGKQAQLLDSVLGKLTWHTLVIIYGNYEVMTLFSPW